MNCRSQYLAVALNHKCVREVINGLKKLIKDNNLEFDSIVVRGMSGSLIGPILAHELGKEIIIVRKDGSHSCLVVEGNFDCKKYIIVDDCICSGSTVRVIEYKMRSFIPNAVCYGVLLYNDSGDNYKINIEEKQPPYKLDVYRFVLHGQATFPYPFFGAPFVEKI